MAINRSLLTLLAAGALATPAALAAEDRTPLVSNRTMKALPVGHIYYNPATGERVITPFEDTARDTNNALWISNNTDPCITGGTIGVIDDTDLDGDGEGDLFGGDCDTGTFPCEGSWHNWWGDIAFDSVIDCVVTMYGSCVPDFDLDSNSIGDGVVGFDLMLSFSDNDDGFGSDGPGMSGRSCLLELTVPTLPGQLPSQLPIEYFAVYRLTIDFADTAPSMIFELGDSDGVDDAGTGISGGAIYGHPTGVDKDSDGLADFSFGLRFDQSTLDTSGIRGETKGPNGYLVVAPKLGNPGDPPPHPADATGLFDAVDIYSTGPSCPPETSPYIGTFSFGGFSCATGTPFSGAWLELYGRTNSPQCPADLDNSGPPLDFTDVLLFLTDFAGPCTDAIGNFDHSTGGSPNNCNFNDVIAFLTNFTSPQCGN